MPGPSRNALPAATMNATAAAAARARTERNSAGAIASVTTNIACPMLVPFSSRSQFQAISQPARPESSNVLRKRRLRSRRCAELRCQIVTLPEDGDRDADRLQPEQLRPAGRLGPVE